tara:strand:+ start:327 stop:593 length:267 start_codon:yes stop_codon:yes gene_type:complete
LIKLKQHKGETMTFQKEIINYGYGCDETNSIAIVWCIDDVKSIRPDLLADECMHVLKYAERKHDPELGLSWETLECIAEQRYPKRRKA